MRITFLLLLAANLALLAWFQHFSFPDSAVDPEPARRQISPEKIRVLSPVRPRRANRRALVPRKRDAALAERRAVREVGVDHPVVFERLAADLYSSRSSSAAASTARAKRSQIAWPVVATLIWPSLVVNTPVGMLVG